MSWLGLFEYRDGVKRLRKLEAHLRKEKEKEEKDDERLLAIHAFCMANGWDGEDEPTDDDDETAWTGDDEM